MALMKTWLSGVMGRLAPFAGDSRGATAVMFGLMALPLICLALGAVDLSRKAVMRQALQDSLDASALIVARSAAKTDAEIDRVGDEAFAADFETANYANYSATFRSAPDNGVAGTATASISPLILGLFGVDELRSNVTTLVKRAQGTPIEVVLVLDTTLSMDGQPLTDLKAAATSMVNDLHKNASGPHLKIGVVPFGQYVNVGVSRRNASYMTTPADYSTTKPAPVPAKCTTTDTKTTTTCQKQNSTCMRDGRAQPCVVDVNCVKTTVPITPVTTCEGPTTKNFKFNGCAGSPAHPDNVADTNALRKYPGLMNVSCNTEITPLTADKATITKAIAALKAKDLTYIPAGLAWGFNMLSQAQPLTDAAAYDPSGANLQPRKALVLMTDGANTVVMQAATADMGGYGFRHDKGAAPATQANTYTTELCNNIKAQKIEVFTVAFMIDDANAKKLVESCATDAAHYFDASDAAKLQAAFGAIAESLRSLYIAQ